MERKGVVSLLLAFILLFGAAGNVLEANAASKVKLNKTKATITVGKTVTLKVKNTKKKVKWSSSNKRIATVSSKGKVKGKKAGKVTITAKIGKKKYKCKVTVKKKTTKRKPANAATEQTTSTTTEQNTDKQPGEEQQTPGNPSTATTNYNAGEYSITKSHSGEGTFYDRISTGAANLDYMESSYYTAAMNNEDYMNGLAGAYIEVTDKDGDKVKVVITDRLPEGKKGDIDLSRKAFGAIEPLVTGRMNITWKIVPFPTTEPISYVFKPTSSQYWAEVQVRDHRYPIKKLEYKDANGQYVELKRQEYNYFTASSGMGKGPYTFRVTDFYGHVLIDTGITMNATETPVKGKANFPY